MNKKTAKELMKTLAMAEVPFQKIDSIASNLEGKEKEILGTLLAEVTRSHFGMLALVVKQFPEFDPDAEGKEFYSMVKEKHGSKYT